MQSVNMRVGISSDLALNSVPSISRTALLASVYQNRPHENGGFFPLSIKRIQYILAGAVKDCGPEWEWVRPTDFGDDICRKILEVAGDAGRRNDCIVNAVRSIGVSIIER